MKHRNILFGYRYDNGKIVLDETKVIAVKFIFSEYISGKSLSSIAKELNARKTEYVSGVDGWNKSRIMRLLEDERYIGAKKHPIIISKNEFDGVRRIREIKNRGKIDNEKNEVFTIKLPLICPYCGGILKRRVDSRYKNSIKWDCKNPDCKTAIVKLDEDLLSDLTELLNSLIFLPDRVEIPKNGNMSKEELISKGIEAVCSEIYDDRETGRKKILELAAKRYKEIDSSVCVAKMIRDIFTTIQPLKKFSKELLNRTTKEIKLYKNGSVSLILKNGQEITR